MPAVRIAASGSARPSSTDCQAWFAVSTHSPNQGEMTSFFFASAACCAMPVNEDADVKTFWDRWAGGGAVIAQQAALAKKKDVISPWFGEWVETANQAWQSVLLGRAEPEAAMRTAAAKWTELRRAFR